MTNSGEIVVSPQFSASNQLEGFSVDVNSIDTMENVICSVQNIAERRNKNDVLQDGIAYHPFEILDMREALWDCKRDSDTLNIGFVDLALAWKVSDYIVLLQANSHNRRYVEKKMRPRFGRPEVPQAPILASAEKRRFNFRRNKMIDEAKARHEAAMAKWLAEDDRHDAAILLNKMNMERGFEAANIIYVLIRSLQAAEAV